LNQRRFCQINEGQCAPLLTLIGYLAQSDLADYRVDFCQPISVNYRGYDVWEIPPDEHGLIAPMAKTFGKLITRRKPEALLPKR
jgi:hypothetical protein